MSIFYDLIFFIAAIIYIPIYLFKKKFHRGFILRLGFLPRDLTLNRPIWIHAVSVGEAMAVRGLVEELRNIYPDKRFVISTVTPTGNKIAKSMASENDFVTYLPLDFSFIVKAVIDKINPGLFIIAETEIWPNLISYLYNKNIPIFVVNGRISDRSFGGYLAIKFLVRPILNKITFFCVQTQRDAERLIRLGVSGDKIRVTGNMKFDIKDYADFKKTRLPEQARDYTDYRLKLGLSSKEKLFIAASTHPGEEEIILGTYKELLNEFPFLRFLIAPRHPERALEIIKLIKKFDFESMRISVFNRQTAKPRNPQTIFILDAVGQLMSFYAISDIVFVGGSLTKIGGHNILEPASLGKPIIFGPYMFNFKDIADLFLNNNACLSVPNKAELKQSIKELLNSPYKMEELGKKAKDLIVGNQGATRRNLELIKSLW